MCLGEFDRKSGSELNGYLRSWVLLTGDRENKLTTWGLMPLMDVPIATL